MSPNIPAKVFLRFFIVSSESSPVSPPPPPALREVWRPKIAGLGPGGGGTAPGCGIPLGWGWVVNGGGGWAGGGWEGGWDEDSSVVRRVPLALLKPLRLLDCEAVKKIKKY